MTRLLSLLWISLCFAWCLHPVAAQEAVTRAEVLQAIARFRAEPQGAAGLSNTTPILRFVLQSPEVVVSVSPKVTPFFQEPHDQPTKSRLLAAYGAGNVLAQFARQEKKDQPLAGVKQLIETYRQLQRSHPGLKSAGIEQLIELQKQGRLEAYLAG